MNDPKVVTNEGVLAIYTSQNSLVAVFPINHLHSITVEEFVEEEATA